ncbi:hypothetical protein BV898_14940 [Hypsibius exemplaris]|uniref:Uncharacterized protein n=1 Tax=Hypsibius exemplaris TaxID=2072580 RepID=A0A9X6ND31_HYPEX|nr:hypothetical protein BV898_14940 [Hypsibius exemplaris]
MKKSPPIYTMTFNTSPSMVTNTQRTGLNATLLGVEVYNVASKEAKERWTQFGHLGEKKLEELKVVGADKYQAWQALKY